jgi:phosphoribosylformylglycinamidine synthase
LLIEACLELMASDAIVAIQDMGAAGLTSSSVEMASKGGVGIELDMDAVPCREERMTPYEMMLSESQERMLMVLKPGREAEAEAIFRKWELDFAVIGTVTDTGRMELVWNGATVADIPLGPLADEAPLYERPYAAPKSPEPPADIPESTDIAADLLKLMASPNLASRRWIWEQYDQSVGADTVQRPGGDAAVVRVHGTRKALAMTTDCTPRYCHADPYEGGKQAVAEAYRNLCAVGARPLAITNCLNFGNPQRPEIMGQFVACVEGMAEACRALDFPVVSGNVSLYNETKADDGTSQAILPTPAIGAVGLLDDWEKSVGIGLEAADSSALILIGGSGRHLDQSLWLRECRGLADGRPPPVDLVAERRCAELVRRLIGEGKVRAAHDLSDGGLLVGLAEMCLAGTVGAWLGLIDPAEHSLAQQCFGEDQGRYIIQLHVDHWTEATEGGDPQLAALGQWIGGVLNDSEPMLEIHWAEEGSFVEDIKGWKTVAHLRRHEIAKIPLADLRAAHEGFFPNLMGAEGVLA